MTDSSLRSGEGLRVRGALPAHAAPILTPDALAFLVSLHRRFDGRRRELLEARAVRQRRLDQGDRPRFLPETATIRSSDWQVAPVPEELLDRRVEITGPVDRKGVIDALNSGANVFVADFEDSNSPTWDNNLAGQINLRDAVRRQAEFTHPVSGEHCSLVDDPAVLFVRPRGWHLEERGVEVDGRSISGALFDFGLYFFHNAHELSQRGSAPYFYLPKLESHLEARLWNDVFVHAQEVLKMPHGTIKATVLIETLPAAFEMNEILWELRDHSAGLNCGRWDYLFSFIKTLRADPQAVVPDRGSVGMDRHFLRSCSELVVKTCHRRGAFAIGGMAARIPIQNDPEANQRALDEVRADKAREVAAGHDGTWIGHQGLVAIAREEFARIDGTNQLGVLRHDVDVSEADLLKVPQGERTEAGLRQNLRVGVQYLEAWLGGSGCVPIDHILEDAATAEISRAQVWQWLHHNAALAEGRAVTPELVATILDDELESLRMQLGEERLLEGHFELARTLFERLLLEQELAPFLTTVAYDHV